MRPWTWIQAGSGLAWLHFMASFHGRRSSTQDRDHGIGLVFLFSLVKPCDSQACLLLVMEARILLKPLHAWTFTQLGWHNHGVDRGCDGWPIPTGLSENGVNNGKQVSVYHSKNSSGSMYFYMILHHLTWSTDQWIQRYAQSQRHRCQAAVCGVTAEGPSGALADHRCCFICPCRKFDKGPSIVGFMKFIICWYLWRKNIVDPLVGIMKLCHNKHNYVGKGLNKPTNQNYALLFWLGSQRV